MGTGPVLHAHGPPARPRAAHSMPAHSPLLTGTPRAGARPGWGEHRRGPRAWSTSGPTGPADLVGQEPGPLRGRSLPLPHLRKGPPCSLSPGCWHLPPFEEGNGAGAGGGQGSPRREEEKSEGLPAPGSPAPRGPSPTHSHPGPVPGPQGGAEPTLTRAPASAGRDPMAGTLQLHHLTQPRSQGVALTLVPVPPAPPAHSQDSVQSQAWVQSFQTLERTGGHRSRLLPAPVATGQPGSRQEQGPAPGACLLLSQPCTRRLAQGNQKSSSGRGGLGSRLHTVLSDQAAPAWDREEGPARRAARAGGRREASREQAGARRGTGAGGKTGEARPPSPTGSGSCRDRAGGSGTPGPMQRPKKPSCFLPPPGEPATPWPAAPARPPVGSTAWGRGGQAGPRGGGLAARRHSGVPGQGERRGSPHPVRLATGLAPAAHASSGPQARPCHQAQRRPWGWGVGDGRAGCIPVFFAELGVGFSDIQAFTEHCFTTAGTK